MKRAAVIGLGDISMVHIPALLAHPEIELVAVCDVVKENRSWVPEEIPFYTDYVEMVKAEIANSIFFFIYITPLLINI